MVFREILADTLSNIVLCSLGEADIKPIPEQIDIDMLIRIASEHHIMNIVGQYLMNVDGIEANKLDSIKKRCIESCFMGLTQVHEIECIKLLFEKCGIENMFLKGVYMKEYYPKSELREMSDIDICVKEEKIEIVKELLEKNGYCLIKRISNHDVYFKPPCINVEIHKNLFKKEIDQKQHDFFGDFNRAELIDGLNCSYKQTHEEFYIYMIAHMAGHFYKRGCGIRNLIDIHVFKKKYGDVLDWEYINEALEKCGLSDFEKHICTLTDMWLGNQKFTVFYYDMFEYMINCGIYGKDEYGIWNEFANVEGSAVSNNKLLRKIWYMFPPLHYMKKYYKVLRSVPLLLPVCWIVRIIRGLIFNKGKSRRKYLSNIDMRDLDMIQNIYRKVKLNFE